MFNSGQQNVLMGSSSLVPPQFRNASLYMDFANKFATVNGKSVNIYSLLSCTRSSTKYVQNGAGIYLPVVANLPAIGTGTGLLSEQAGTNIALWNRDLTNANWTKSNATVALDQVGIDGLANSASSVLATASNATVTAAAITSASASRTQGWFIQRITGSGAISVSQDGGATFIAVTTKVGATWYRASSTDFSGLTQTVTNPQLVIKLATSGDKIAVDFVDLEAGGFCTSPILTTTASATRAADVITLTGAAQTAALAAKAGYWQASAANAVGLSAMIFAYDAAGGTAVLFVGVTTVKIQSGANSTTVALGSGATTANTKVAAGFDATSMTVIANGGGKATSANAWTAGTTPCLGNDGNGNRALNGYMRRAVFGPIKGQFDALTN